MKKGPTLSQGPPKKGPDVRELTDMERARTVMQLPKKEYGGLAFKKGGRPFFGGVRFFGDSILFGVAKGYLPYFGKCSCGKMW